MSAVPERKDDRKRLALGLARAGYRIFPLKPNTKEPATRHGFKDATSDVEQVDAWWTRDPEYNIGLATGMQDNGLCIAVIDVDAKHGGVLAWKQLCRDHGGDWQRYMPIHKTPRAGFHIFGQVDPALKLDAANGFPRGIDTRGDGGYVVVPDSVFIDTETGEIGSYACTPNNLWSTEPGAFPEWVIVLWLAGPQRDSIVRHPSAQVDADSPLAWMKANIDWWAELQRDKFKLDADFGGESRWTRDGKTRGTSLSLHLTGNGCVVVWSDNCPDWMVSHVCGQPTTDGHWSMNGFQYICARDYGGDVKLAMSEIRRTKMPPPGPAGVGGPTTEAVPEASAIALAVPQLPESFWQRPVLAHIRQAAWHHLASPDATLLHVMTRYAATIHPGWLLPMKGTLDVYGVVICPSGAGKGQANKAGRELYPGPQHHEKIWMDRTISSGEGLVEGFVGPKDPNTGQRPVARQATHFIIDEGTTLIAQLGREGATVIGTLCSAWVGEPLGQQLADGSKTRYIPPYTVRVCSTLNIQNELAGELYSDKLKATGFTGRCTFVCGQDPNLPEDFVEDPGPLQLMDWSDPPTYGGALTYPPEVWTAVRAEIIGGHRGTLERDPRQSHRILQQAKWSQVLAMMDGRAAMSLDDWALGGEIVALSGRVLAMLDGQHALAAKVENEKRLQTRVYAETYVEDAKADHAVMRVERRILQLLPKLPTGTKQYQLRQKMGRDKKIFDIAIENLVQGGRVLRAEDEVLSLP